jgi:hypothetical protein
MFDDKEVIAYLEEQGALIWDGVDKTGEAVFKFNLEILKQVMPPLYDQIMQDIDEDLMLLYKEGLVDLEYDDNLNAMFKISEKGKEVFENINPEEFFKNFEE